MHPSAFADRKASYKASPSQLQSAQKARREQALDIQRQKREERVFQARTALDHFAELSLGASDDDDDDAREIASGGLGLYAKLLTPDGSEQPTTLRKRQSKWANVCMYAELLEMSEDESMALEDRPESDGIPDDLAQNWVALVPIPAGKRCLAVSTQANGMAGVGMHSPSQRSLH